MSENVLIAGGSGSVGTHLTKVLLSMNYKVKSLSRNKKRCLQSPDFLYWNSNQGIFELEGYKPDHIINLSGAGIADQKWSKKRKKEIINSRVDSTAFLISSLKNKNIRTKSFVSASAVGFYGHTGNQMAHEDDDPYTDEFLSKVCQLWEQAAMPAEEIADKLSIIRISTVLTIGAGALSKMDKTIPFGMANYLGNGKQYLPWIHIEDLCRFIAFCMSSESTAPKIYNVASPQEVTNYQFTKILRDTINPKAVLIPAPKLSLKLLLGEMSRVVLNSTRVSTEKIETSGFTFRFPHLQEALKDIYKN